MAVLEKETNNYFKIEFEDCMVKGNSVIVAFSTYVTDEERNKEKQRRPLFTLFFNNLQTLINSLQNEIIFSVENLKKSPEEILDSMGKIRREAYPELRAKQDTIIELEQMHNSIFERCYVYGNIEHSPLEEMENKEILIGLGYDENWLKEPIRLTTRAQVYCGEYSGEKIAHAFYYNRLKTKMSDNVEDV